MAGKLRFWMLFVCVWLVSAQAGFSEEATKRFVLDNGLTVLIHEMPSSQTVAVNALVKVGSATEGKYLGAGVSHFVEHMLFKGTVKRAVGQISKEVKALGGVINANTSLDRTMYVLGLPAGYAVEAVDIVADMLMNSVFEPAEIEKEREVVFGEMRMRDDNPDIIVNELAYSAIYTRHPYRHPIIGYKSLFEAVSRDELFEFYKTHYIPNNIILGVGGNVRAEDILPVIESAFKDFEQKPFLTRNLSAEPQQVTPRSVESEYPTEMARLLIAYQGMSIGHRDMFAMDVLAMILGQGRSSRLYRELVDEKKLVQSVSSANDTPLDPGSFEISCTLEEKNIEETLKLIDEQIERIKSRGINRTELEKARRQVLSDEVFSRQSASDIIYDQLISEFLTGDFYFSRKYVEAVRMVDISDVQAAARKYLLPATKTTAVLRPRKEKVSTPVADAGKSVSPSVKKFTLDNGLRVLLKEDHRVPIITVYLAMEGGLRQEPDGLTGLSNLTASLWDKGTSSRSAEVITGSVEARGGNAGGFSGQNSLGLRMNFLKEDTDFALSLLEDLVKNPVFPKAELDKNKDQIKKMLIDQKEDVVTVTTLATQETLFAGHPYSFNPLGSPESIDRVTRDDIVDFYRNLSVAPNMVLAVYGDLDVEEVLLIIKRKFSKLPSGELKLKSFEPRPVNTLQEKVQNLDKEQAVVMVGFQGPKLGSSDEIGVEVLTSLLGSGMNSRLFMKVREELGKAYHMRGRYIPGPDTGFISFYVATNPGDSDKVKDVLTGVLKAVAADGVTDEELRDIKAYLKGTHDMGLETIGSLAAETTLMELYGLGFDRYQKYKTEVDAVSADDLKRLAERYLDFNRGVMIITGPPPEKKKEGL